MLCAARTRLAMRMASWVTGSFASCSVACGIGSSCSSEQHSLQTSMEVEMRKADVADAGATS